MDDSWVGSARSYPDGPSLEVNRIEEIDEEEDNEQEYSSEDEPTTLDPEAQKRVDEILERRSFERSEEDCHLLLEWMKPLQLDTIRHVSDLVALRFCKLAQHRIIQPDTIICREGQHADILYVLVSGQISLWKLSGKEGENGTFYSQEKPQGLEAPPLPVTSHTNEMFRENIDPAILRVHGGLAQEKGAETKPSVWHEYCGMLFPGSEDGNKDMFGELGVFRGVPRNCTMRAETEVQMLTLSKQDAVAVFGCWIHETRRAKLEILRSFEPLAALSHLEKMVDSFQHRVVPARTVLCKEGSPANMVHFIVSGECALFTKLEKALPSKGYTPSGERPKAPVDLRLVGLARLGAGCVLGEDALTSDAKEYQCTAMTETRCEIQSISVEELRRSLSASATVLFGQAVGWRQDRKDIGEKIIKAPSTGPEIDFEQASDKPLQFRMRDFPPAKAIAARVPPRKPYHPRVRDADEGAQETNAHRSVGPPPVPYEIQGPPAPRLRERRPRRLQIQGHLGKRFVDPNRKRYPATAFPSPRISLPPGTTPVAAYTRSDYTSPRHEDRLHSSAVKQIRSQRAELIRMRIERKQRRPPSPPKFKFSQGAPYSLQYLAQQIPALRPPPPKTARTLASSTTFPHRRSSDIDCIQSRKQELLDAIKDIEMEGRGRNGIRDSKKHKAQTARLFGKNGKIRSPSGRRAGSAPLECRMKQDFGAIKHNVRYNPRYKKPVGVILEEIEAVTQGKIETEVLTRSEEAVSPRMLNDVAARVDMDRQNCWEGVDSQPPDVWASKEATGRTIKYEHKVPPRKVAKPFIRKKYTPTIKDSEPAEKPPVKVEDQRPNDFMTALSKAIAIERQKQAEERLVAEAEVKAEKSKGNFYYPRPASEFSGKSTPRATSAKKTARKNGRKPPANPAKELVLPSHAQSDTPVRRPTPPPPRHSNADQNWLKAKTAIFDLVALPEPFVV